MGAPQDQAYHLFLVYKRNLESKQHHNFRKMSLYDVCVVSVLQELQKLGCSSGKYIITKKNIFGDFRSSPNCTRRVLPSLSIKNFSV